jgi:hypothetical protein
VLWDHVDLQSLEYFASLTAAAYIILDDDVTCKETLRSRAFIDLQRYASSKARKTNGILVPYHEDSLFATTNVPGRLVSGLKDLKDAAEYPWFDQVEKLVGLGVSPWQATRALHAGPKYYKEIARGNLHCLDTDRKKSFPNAVLDRHPLLDAVESWCITPEKFATACGFDVSIPSQYKLVKDFCNSAAGSGHIFEESWLVSAGLTSLPEMLILYREQLRIAARHDVEQRPELASAFKSLGLEKQAVSSKTHYVCNSEIERRESEDAMRKREVMVETIAFESDGHPCTTVRTRTTI